MNAMNSLGRNKLHWKEDLWARIDQAVHDEAQRTRVAAKFIPMHGPIPAGETTVPSDTIGIDGQSLSIDETATTPVVEILVDFKLTPQQVEREQDLKTAVTLATRATNLLSQAEDILIFNGQDAVTTHPLFKQGKVRLLSGNAGTGLLNAALSQVQTVGVPALDPANQKFGENTFAKVAEAYSRLQSGEGLSQAHYGPYALVLRTEPYADTYAPVLTNQVHIANTLAITADRIKPLVTEGFYGTGTLPRLTGDGPCEGWRGAERFYGTGTLPRLTGVLVSLGGNTMDLVRGMDMATAYLQEDPDGRYRFRVYERFALRFKDTTAIIKLVFKLES